MKKSVGNNIRLGVFISIAVSLFIAGIYFIGSRQQLFSNTFIVSGIFEDINGLQIGNNIRFSGINVGIVENIKQITDSTVRVDMRILEENQKFIKKNVIAVIGSDGLMGSKLVMLVSGITGHQMLMNKDTVETVAAVSIDDIIISLKITADNAALISSDLEVVTGNIRAGRGTVGMLLMDSVFADEIGKTLGNIKQGTKGFERNMDAASHNILLRGYIKKKAREKAKAKEELLKLKDNSKN